MDTVQLAGIVREASKKGVVRYLQMCRLDSPWEVPEVFLAAEAAKALADAGLRVSIEFKLDRATNAPTQQEIVANQKIWRLQRAYAHLDVAILKSDDEPWKLTIDGIVEFKKHFWLEDDAGLIEFMLDGKNLLYGVLALFVVGSSPEHVEQEFKKLTVGLARWKSASPLAPSKYDPEIPNSDVKGRCWDVCCLVPA